MTASTLSLAGSAMCPNVAYDDLEQRILALYDGYYESANLYDAKLVDIDADGDQDLFVLAYLWPVEFDLDDQHPMIYQFENVGTSSTPEFVLLERSVAWEFEQQNGFSWAQWTYLQFVDIDNDGDQDLVVSGVEIPTVARNLGTPAAARLVKEVVPGLDQGEYATHLSFADIDGDAFPDAVLSSDIGVMLRKNNGNRRNLEFLMPPESWSDIGRFGFLADAYLYPAAFHDVDRDGDLDLVGGGPLLLNTGNAQSPFFDLQAPQYLTPYNNVIGASNMADGQFVDFDYDGDKDFVSNPWAVRNTVYFMRNNGSADNPFYMPVSANSDIQLQLSAATGMGGIAEVTMTLTNEGNEAQRVGFTTMSEEGKTQIARGPTYLNLPAGQTRIRRFQISYKREKLFAVSLEDNLQNSLGCQSVVLKN